MRTAASFLLTLLAASGAWAQGVGTDRVETDSCPATLITCGQHVAASLSTSDCTYATWTDMYRFAGNVGDTVTIRESSSAFDPIVYLADPSGSIVAWDDNGGGATDSRLTYTLTTSGQWLVLATSVAAGVTGAYTLDFTCGTAGSCVRTSTQACLLDGRFSAVLRYRNGFDDSPADTTAFVKPVDGFASSNYETSFFYFNSENNIEVMLKMLDQGNVDGEGHPTIAVLFGTATPLRVELSLTDTLTSVTRSYTSSFNAMSGVTDFMAFRK